MPRRSSENELVNISRKLQKIERRLKQTDHPPRPRKRILRMSSSSSNDSSNSSDTQNTGKSPALPKATGNEADVESILLEIDEQQNQLAGTSTAPISEIINDHNNEAFIRETTPGKEIPQDVIDSEVLEILGDDPSATVEYGSNIRKELSTRFEHIAINGLNKDLRKELQEKYLIPGNCAKIGAPTMNPDIKAAIPETVCKRDRFIEARQKKIAVAISCLANTISSQLDQTSRDNKLLKNLMDASRLLCDIQNDESLTRRNFAISTLKKETKDSLYNTKIDKFLFGENLTESLRAAKAVSKSGTELKPGVKKNPLNWKTPVGTRRPPPTPSSQVSVAATVRPYQPYQPYQTYRSPRPPPRHTRTTSWRAPPPPPPRSTRKR